jgi:hypothetical protein
MGIFDQLAGLEEGYTRRHLKTLDEAGGAKKSSPAATTDYGPAPRNTVHGTPNSAFRPQPKQDYGSDATMKGKKKAAALRSSKPYQYGTK